MNQVHLQTAVLKDRIWKFSFNLTHLKQRRNNNNVEKLRWHHFQPDITLLPIFWYSQHNHFLLLPPNIYIQYDMFKEIFKLGDLPWNNLCPPCFYVLNSAKFLQNKGQNKQTHTWQCSLKNF